MKIEKCFGRWEELEDPEKTHVDVGSTGKLHTDPGWERVFFFPHQFYDETTLNEQLFEGLLLH